MTIAIKMAYLIDKLLTSHLLLIIDWLWYAVLVFAALLLLFIIVRSLRYSRKRVLLARLSKHLTPFYTAEQIKKALSAYVAARFRYTEGGEIMRENLISYFVEEVFNKKHFEYNYFMILGQPGMGKTSFFINLFWTYRYQLLKKDFKIKLIALNHFGSLEAIQNTPNPHQTVLLLDGLDEDYLAIQNYKARLDELIQHTQKFAKVIISCRTGFLPIELERPTVNKAIAFVGDNSYQLMGKIYIDPFDETDVFTYVKKRLNLLEIKKRVQAQGLHLNMPYLFSRPLFLNYSSYLLDGGTIKFEYTYQVFEEIIHRLIAKDHIKNQNVEERKRIYEFWIEVAWDIYANWEERKDLWIDEETLNVYKSQYQIEGLSDKKSLLRKHHQGYFCFEHPAFIGFLVAWRSFFHPQEKVDASFKGLSMAAVCYQELCWEKYAQQFSEVRGYFRTSADYSKRPLSGIKIWELKNITRLYLEDYRRRDLRFLKGLTSLKGLYLINGEIADLTPNLVSQLSHNEVFIYLMTEEQLKVLKVNAAPIALEVDGYNDMAYQWEPPQVIDLWKNPDPAQIYIPKVNGKSPSEAILKVFGMDLKKMPNESCKQIGDGSTSQGLNYQIYEQFAGFSELEVFNKMYVNLFPDGSKNVLFQNTYTPTLLMQSLSELVERLVQIYGEDDTNKAEFDDDDKAQVEDGLWLGRRWAWGNTDSYAYPLHLFMDKPGDINLVVYGIR